MTQPSERLSRLVESIYEAAFDETRWSATLKDICDLFHGSRACIVHVDAKGCGVLGSYPDQAFETANWHVPGSEVLMAAMRAVRPGQTYVQSKVLDVAQFRKTDAWRDLFSPRDMDDGIGCHVVAATGAVCTIDISRSKRQGPYTDDDIALFDFLKPHLIRANQIGGSLQNNSTNRTLRARQPLGLVVVGQDQQIYLRNDEADDMFARQDIPLTDQTGMLTAARALEGAQLRKMLASACSMNADLNASAGGIALFQPDNSFPDGPRLMVCVTPMPRSIVGEGRAQGLAAVAFRETWRELSISFDNRRPILLSVNSGQDPATAQANAAQSEAERTLTLAAARSYLHGVFKRDSRNLAAIRSA